MWLWRTSEAISITLLPTTFHLEDHVSGGNHQGLEYTRFSFAVDLSKLLDMKMDSPFPSKKLLALPTLPTLGLRPCLSRHDQTLVWRCT